MQVEIYINEEKLDTDVATKIAETKQVNDFLEIHDRQTSRTNSFKLPKTERNIRILKGMGIVGNTSIVPYRIHNVSVYRNGIQTIADGIGYFQDTNSYFNMYVYNENINLFDTIGDKSLADLNFSSLNHDLNISNWLNSFSRKDYTYAVADYGKLDGSTIEVNYQIPSFYVSYLWNKIFNESGFKWKYVGRGGRNDYNPFLKEEWKEIAISIDEGFPEEKESVNPEKKLQLSKYQVREYKGKTINILGNEIIVQELTGEINEYVRFVTDFDEDGLHLLSSSEQYNRSRIRIKENGFYKLNINGLFYNLQTESASMYVEKDGYDLFTVKEEFEEGENSFGMSEKVYLREGDELFVKVATHPKDNELNYSYDFALELWLDNTVTTVNFSSYLSKIKQKDFIKDVVQYYGLLFRRKRDTYEFISMEELLNPLAEYANYNANENDAVYDDWSGKFHGVVSESSKVGKYARNNLFKYKYDNSENTYADAVLKIDDQTLGNEGVLIQRPYRAPDRSSSVAGNDPLRKCNLYEREYDDDGNLKSVKPIKGEPYFFRVRKKQTSLKYKMTGATGNNTYRGSVPFMSFDDLDFNNILPNRYAAFANMVNYGRRITAELNLSVLDIHILDFFRLKYIKQLGRLYYVNKVSNYTGKGLTKTELIQMRTVEKLGEFSDDFSDDFNN